MDQKKDCIQKIVEKYANDEHIIEREKINEEWLNVMFDIMTTPDVEERQKKRNTLHKKLHEYNQDIEQIYEQMKKTILEIREDQDKRKEQNDIEEMEKLLFSENND